MFISVAVDGPAGAGKSTISKAAAKALGYLYIDTGAMYRAVALYVINHGGDTKSEESVSGFLDDIVIDLKDNRVYLCGEDVTEEIRTPRVSIGSSDVAVFPPVRIKLCELQRAMAEKQNVIMDGRDVGTYVLPGAQVKIFLSASPEIRAERRLAELAAKGDSASYDEVLADIKYRDKNDSTRKMAPLRRADDAVLLDTGNMDIEQSVEALLNIVYEKTGGIE